MSMRSLVMAAVVLMSFSTVASAQDQAPAGNAKAGAALYKAIGCWECHGTVGQGGALSGPRIADTALPYAAYLAELRTPQNQMPPYEPAILTNADAANIYAFLKSIPASPAAKDIPLLNE